MFFRIFVLNALVLGFLCPDSCYPGTVDSSLSLASAAELSYAEFCDYRNVENPESNSLESTESGRQEKPVYYWTGNAAEIFEGELDDAELRRLSRIHFFSINDETEVFFHANRKNWTFLNWEISIRTTDPDNCLIGLSWWNYTRQKTEEIKARLSEMELTKKGEKEFLITKGKFLQRKILWHGNQGGFYPALLEYTKDQLQEKYGYKLTDSTERPWWRVGRNGVLSFVIGDIALGENLSLDTEFEISKGANYRSINIESLKTVTVDPIAWETIQKGKKPILDPLSKAIPFDQHVLFFKSYQHFKMIRTSLGKSFQVYTSLFNADEIEPVLKFYQNQMGVDFEALNRAKVGRQILSVAVTGSDLHFLEGTDVAIILQCRSGEAVMDAILKSRDEIWKDRKVTKSVSSLMSMKVHKTRNQDRSICQLVARHGNTVIICNSAEQLKRIEKVLSRKVLSVSELQEYHYFRTTYPLHQPESVFMFLSDPTIRRWCNPRWRIGGDRRSRIRRVMESLVGRKMLKDAGLSSSIKYKKSDFLIAPFRIDQTDILTSQHGSLRFQTPIIEYDLRKVSEREKKEYELWLDRYQNNRWSRGFDPIGLRVRAEQVVEKEHVWNDLDLDLLVMPLSDNSAYSIIGMILSEQPGGKIQLVHGKKQVATFAVDRMSPMAWSFLTNYRRITESEASLQMSLSYDSKNGNLILRPSMFVKTEKKLDLKAIERLFEKEGDGTKYKTVVMFENNLLTWGQAEETGYAFTTDGNKFYLTDHLKAAKKIIDRYFDKSKKGPEDRYRVQSWLDQTSARLFFSFYPGNLPARNIDDRFSIVASFEDDILSSVQEKIDLMNLWRQTLKGRDPVQSHFKYFHRSITNSKQSGYYWDSDKQTYQSSKFGSRKYPKRINHKRDLFSDFDAFSASLDFPENGLRARVRFRKNANK